MQNTIEISGKKVLVEWSAAADKQMRSLAEPLCVEMELYFSCLIRKAVRFGGNAHSGNFTLAAPKLSIGFRPVMTKICRVSDVEGAPPLEDFPIVRPEAFVPKRLAIDYRSGKSLGEFFLDKSTVA
ncbi:hypothetical protein [Sideroxydans lithotrophicus]|uniref:Uncharacterized protein n=1 Tax=Sideroxydans lithotrophicus (strain ES-1) TaxID=580332 RepID=D5CR07_SIDLE|nr:hypothetical protein [Sideroxydans lithotrophicus]ADE11393.1 conserved hypothetical protein [Sideroxydans lithotrophicus ES-1]